MKLSILLIMFSLCHVTSAQEVKRFTRGCGNTKPKFCVGERVTFQKWTPTVVAYLSDGTYMLGQNPVPFTATVLSKSVGRGKTVPSFCVGDEITTTSGYNRAVTGFNPTTKRYNIKDVDDSFDASQMRILKKADCSSQLYISNDDIMISLSIQTPDIVDSFNQLSRVTTKERSQFLRSLSASIAKQNSPHVNIFAAFALSKLVQFSTAQVIQDRIRPEVDVFVQDLEKQGWTSFMQVKASDEMVQYAIQVIAAGIRVRNSQASLEPSRDIRLSQLAEIGAKSGSFARANALKEFLSANMILIEDLVADPRHGAIGSIVADTAQWLNKQFEE